MTHRALLHCERSAELHIAYMGRVKLEYTRLRRLSVSGGVLTVDFPSRFGKGQGPAPNVTWEVEVVQSSAHTQFGAVDKDVIIRPHKVVDLIQSRDVPSATCSRSPKSRAAPSEVQVL